MRRAWLRWPRLRQTTPDPQSSDAWQAHVMRLAKHGLAAPGACLDPSKRRPATQADQDRLYAQAPSFVDLLPWVEYLPDAQCMLLDDGRSVAAFFELQPLATEGREPDWFAQARDAVETALQETLDEHDESPWVVQFYAQDEPTFETYLNTLSDYVRPLARHSVFTDYYLGLTARHLQAVSTPGGLFDDTTVTQLPWRGQHRRTRMVVYRRLPATTRRSPVSAPEQDLNATCDRLTAALASAGVSSTRLDAAAIHDWLLRWFNPDPTHLGHTDADKARLYTLTRYPDTTPPDALELASGTDFAQRLFFTPPRSDRTTGVWYFDDQPHRVLVVDRLRQPPEAGHLSGEMRHGEALNAVMDQLPAGTVMCLTVVATPQDGLEAQLNTLARKAVGDTLASLHTRQDVEQARALIGGQHKLYRGALAFYVRAPAMESLRQRCHTLNNVLLTAGLQVVREDAEVAPLNSYLRWLPAVFDPAADRRHWYTQLMFVQHAVNLAPVWGRSTGTGHPGITFFNRGGGLVTFDPLSRLDRQMNAHLFLFGPTGSGKSATLNYLLQQVTALYRPRLFIVEAGNSFGLFADFAARLGLSVHRVTLTPGSGISLAPFADAWRLVTPTSPKALDSTEGNQSEASDEQRDVLGELEIIARLMITGGDPREDARMTRADRSLLRQCLLATAERCVAQGQPVLTRDLCATLREQARDDALPEPRRARLLDMAEAMSLFCQGSDGELFDRPGTPWPEADITLVDLATFAREGYGAQLAVAYVSLINAVNNLAERDQFLGRPLINVTDEGHIITKNPLLAPYVVKITKMWRKLGAWFWLATQNLDDLPAAAEPMLNMIEWWICLSMPPDEVEKIARFRELTPAQKALMRSARKEAGKFSEGVILSKSMETLFRVVPPSLVLALAMTDPEEKAERYRYMQQDGLSELDAAFKMAEALDQQRGITTALLDPPRPPPN